MGNLRASYGRLWYSAILVDYERDKQDVRDRRNELIWFIWFVLFIWLV
jgi:hypothetical protein